MYTHLTPAKCKHNTALHVVLQPIFLAVRHANRRVRNNWPSNNKILETLCFFLPSSLIITIFIPPIKLPNTYHLGATSKCVFSFIFYLLFN